MVPATWIRGQCGRDCGWRAGVREFESWNLALDQNHFIHAKVKRTPKGVLLVFLALCGPPSILSRSNAKQTAFDKYFPHKFWFLRFSFKKIRFLSLKGDLFGSLVLMVLIACVGGTLLNEYGKDLRFSDYAPFFGKISI